MERIRGLEYWHMDAERGGSVADDLAHTIAFDGGADADSNEFASFFSGTSCWCACRYN
jgi:hypothetical protein